MSCSGTLYLAPFKQGLSLILELSIFQVGRLASKPVIFLFMSNLPSVVELQVCQAILILYVGAGDTISGPNTSGATGVLPTH